MDDTCEVGLDSQIVTIDRAAEVTVLANSAIRSKPIYQFGHDSQNRHVDVLLLQATVDIIRSPNSLVFISTPSVIR